ncbi:hypothetical protein VXE65_22750 [Mycolicibacterium conceptionense]|uniref:hypothetical protein n=1 Tax=Mycolicibacterium conceptionense TaxID=451644 RepID=UPI00320479BF
MKETLTLTTPPGVTMADMRDVDQHLRRRLGSGYEYTELPAPGPAFNFTLSGDESAGFTLQASGSTDDIRHAIARWCGCCSTPEQVKRRQRLDPNDPRARFADDERTSVVTISWYQPVPGSADRHLKNRTRLTLGAKGIPFMIAKHSIG